MSAGSSPHALALSLREIALGTRDYEQTVALRRAVLLDPFGIPLAEARRDDAIAVHWAAFVLGRCAACLLLVARDAGICQLRQMAVRPDLQRQGIGRQLVMTALERAREAGFTSIMASAREPAVTFYERLGFSTEGEPFEQVGLPHRTVVRSLSG